MFNINKDIINAAKAHVAKMIKEEKKEDRVEIPGTPMTIGIILESGLTDENKINLMTDEEFSTEDGVKFFISR